MKTDDAEVEQLLAEAEARELIRKSVRKRRTDRKKLVVVLFAGTLFSVVSFLDPDAWWIWCAALGIFLFSFGAYLGVHGFPPTYEGELPLSKVDLELFSKFGREGRKLELVLVTVVPLVGLTARIILSIVT